MPKQLHRYVAQIRTRTKYGTWQFSKNGDTILVTRQRTQQFFFVMQTYIVTNKYIKDRTPIECVIDDGEGPSLRVYVLY